MNSLGKLVRERRRALGLSQQALAARLELDQTYVSKIENEVTSFPFRNAGQLAKALEVRTEDVVHAILGPAVADVQAVEDAFRQVEDGQRETRRLKPKRLPPQVIEVPVFFEASTRGADILEKPEAPIATLRVMPNDIQGSTPVAYLLDHTFPVPLDGGFVIASVPRDMLRVGDGMLIETKDRKAYFGVLALLGTNSVELNQYDSPQTAISIPHDNIWAWYKIDRWQR